jgi:peptidoglycan/LPS O-acetylase OafA/YrhL
MNSFIPNYKYLDSLRGIAILMVVLIHTSQWIIPDSKILLSIASKGGLGVQLFFIVSAFTLSNSMLIRQNEKFAIKNFFIRRFFRVVPLFYMGIIIYTTYYGFESSYYAPDGKSKVAVIATLLFSHIWHPEWINSIVPGGWSIGNEVLFYFLLPILFKYCFSLKKILWLFISSIAISFLFGIISSDLLKNLYEENQYYLVDSFIFFHFFSQLPVFLLGMFTFQFCYNAYDLKINRYVIYILLASTIGITLFTDCINEFIPIHLKISIFFSILLIYLKNRETSLLINKAFIKVGQYSYGIYIYHFFILALIKNNITINKILTNDILLFAFYLLIVLISLGIAIFSYKLIEYPSIKLGKKLITNLST